MDRRATIASLLGRPPAKAPAPPLPIVQSGLEPYTGPWAYEQAAHLLRRAMFGPSYEQIKTAAALGLATTLQQLFEERPLPEPPLNHNNQNDPTVPIGSTWINAPYSTTVNLRPYRIQSLRAWTMQQLFQEGVSIREQLTLFWHNHFGIANVNDAKFRYIHATLLRSSAWGNFRELIKAVTIDPAMLRFLNGNQNTSNSPNENYARELVELFTIGKGPQAGPGDYTHYTEGDIGAMARVLTGWRDRGFNATNPDVPLESYYTNNRHDLGEKQLSHRFDNIVIPNMGPQEYAHLIDIIFQKDETARFICRKLYRWFVYYVIDDQVEQNVIEPMAQVLISNDYAIRPALEALLGSAHFFDMLNVGPMIKNPLAFIVSAAKPFAIAMPPDVTRIYNAMLRFFASSILQQMDYYELPSVAGWKAYHQEPLYYRMWVNATTLPERMKLTDTMVSTGFVVGGFRVRINPLPFVATLDNPFDPNAVIEEFSRILFPQPITEGQKAALKEVLIPGLPDYEWTVEYSDHLSNPGNTALAQSVAAKLNQLLQAMFSMPEFHLS